MNNISKPILLCLLLLNSYVYAVPSNSYFEGYGKNHTNPTGTSHAGASKDSTSISPAKLQTNNLQVCPSIISSEKKTEACGGEYSGNRNYQRDLVTDGTVWADTPEKCLPYVKWTSWKETSNNCILYPICKSPVRSETGTGSCPVLYEGSTTLSRNFNSAYANKRVDPALCFSQGSWDSWTQTSSSCVQTKCTCSPGTFSIDNMVCRDGGSNPSCWDQMHAKFKCETPSNGTMSVTLYAHGRENGATGWQGATVPENMATTPAPIPENTQIPYWNKQAESCTGGDNGGCSTYTYKSKTPTYSRVRINGTWQDVQSPPSGYVSVYADKGGYWVWLGNDYGWGRYLQLAKPHWQDTIRNVPVFLLRSSPGCSADKCSYYFVFNYKNTRGTDGNITMFNLNGGSYPAWGATNSDAIPNFDQYSPQHLFLNANKSKVTYNPTYNWLEYRCGGPGF